MSEPEWNDFRIVCALAAAGSVAGAARELEVDNSTVSRRLAALEEALGADLFMRTARGVVLTPEGHVVLTAARSMSDAVVSCLNAVRASKKGIEGTVRVTCVNSIIPMLAPWISSLRAAFPDLRVELKADDAIVDLGKGEAEIALRMVRPKEPDLIARRALELGWAFYATRSHVDQWGMVSRLEELQTRTLVPYSEKLRGPAFLWFAENFRANHAEAHAGSPEAALSIATLVNAVAFAPCLWADSLPDIVRVYPDPVRFHDIFIVYHETQKDTARVRVVADALMNFLQERRHIFEGRPSTH